MGLGRFHESGSFLGDRHNIDCSTFWVESGEPIFEFAALNSLHRPPVGFRLQASKHLQMFAFAHVKAPETLFKVLLIPDSFSSAS